MAWRDSQRRSLAEMQSNRIIMVPNDSGQNQYCVILYSHFKDPGPLTQGQREIPEGF